MLLGLLVIASVFWYLFVYDRAFTRDFLLKEARINDARNHAALSSWFYKLAYAHSGNDEDVALELAAAFLLLYLPLCALRKMRNAVCVRRLTHELDARRENR